MVKLNEKADILLKYFIEDKSIRKITRETNKSRNTVRKYIRDHEEQLSKLDKSLREDEILSLIENLVKEPQYDSSNRSKRKLTDEIIEEINKCLEKNKKKKTQGKHKQLMKKVDIHDYLVDKGYDISYSTVCNYVREHTKETKEAYIKQVYKPGKTLQFDYGEVKVNIAGENRVLNLALFTTGYGFYSYGKLYENKKIVNFLDAHVNAFKHFGGVHNEIVYDNLKQAVRRFVGPTEKKATEDLVKLSLYYKFNYRFCNVRRGNEKGKVERSVEFVRRRAFSIKDEFDSLKEANQYLLNKLNKLNQIKKNRFNRKSPLDKLNEEKEYLKELMPTYDVARDKECRVNKYSFITIEQNKYSVPDYLVGKFVMAKIYSEKIKVYYKDNLIAEHKRCYKLHKCTIDIDHYLSTLKRKPGALKNSLALEKLAPEIKNIYQMFYNNNSTTKTKEFIELLEIIKEKGLDKVKKAINKLSKNKASMVTTDNIKTLVNRKTSLETNQEDEIIQNSMHLLNNYNEIFNVEQDTRQEVC
ncbi:IS21 family transposase [Selenihalanaerobacter shriftii]|uniref:Transposase n=1 Tax=Selenihalanaerobacter shriftii TaxID=142842 RepID=A0A1T4MLF2_9FIRM|nr:IS21 family transposase [Selenihalanaerobacter shriftii]SJZ67812.1 Transposase [Selenihalanaerobacter shriftii]